MDYRQLIFDFSFIGLQFTGHVNVEVIIKNVRNAINK